jgi:hypothetical protein
MEIKILIPVILNLFQDLKILRRTEYLYGKIGTLNKPAIFAEPINRHKTH